MQRAFWIGAIALVGLATWWFGSNQDVAPSSGNQSSEAAAQRSSEATPQSGAPPTPAGAGDQPPTLGITRSQPGAEIDPTGESFGGEDLAGSDRRAASDAARDSGAGSGGGPTGPSSTTSSRVTDRPGLTSSGGGPAPGRSPAGSTGPAGPAGSTAASDPSSPGEAEPGQAPDATEPGPTARPDASEPPARRAVDPASVEYLARRGLSKNAPESLLNERRSMATMMLQNEPPEVRARIAREAAQAAMQQ